MARIRSNGKVYFSDGSSYSLSSWQADFRTRDGGTLSLLTDEGPVMISDAVDYRLYPDPEDYPDGPHLFGTLSPDGSATLFRAP